MVASRFCPESGTRATADVGRSTDSSVVVATPITPETARTSPTPITIALLRISESFRWSPTS